MTIYNSSKRALFYSVIALIVCIIMLLGATYAWFTDNATSPDNQIQTGNLDVKLYQWVDDATGNDISDSSTKLFPASIIWEPGMTQVVYLSVKNAGTLALKYKLDIVITGITEGTHYNLADVMEYSIVEGTSADPFGYVTEWTTGTKFVNAPGTNATSVADVVLENKDDEDFYAIAIHMLETAGNEYMNKSITFDIDVLAGQATEEKDSFNSDKYDEFAGYAGKAYLPKPVAGQAAVSEKITGKDGYNLASVLIPADAVDPASDKELSVTVADSAYKANISVTAGNTTKAFDVTVEGLKENNDVPVKVDLRIAAGLDPATVKLYHYDTEIPSTYNPLTGYVTFESATFSPFTVAYNPDSKYVAPEAPKDDNGEVLYPVADVTYLGVNAGKPAIEWGNYGQWSPTAGLDSTLEASFKFACPTDLDPEIEAAFEYWYCDFFVSLSDDLGANQIFLGGNYGDFGWIGFHNGDLTLAANKELPLLSSVTTNPWTYADVRDYVGEFICGVGDVNNALEGDTFTVKLRLINPDKVDTTVSEWWANLPADAYIDVNVVTHTFGGSSVIDGVTVVTDAAQLQEAFENADDNAEIQLGGDIDLSDLANGN